MHIFYIGSFRLPNHDAAAARVLNVARALRDAGHIVSFISWGGQYRESDICPDGKYSVDGFEYIITNELDDRGGWLLKAKAKLTRGNKTKKILRQQKNIDVIITYNGSLTRWLLRFTNERHIKLINDITEWYSYSELKITDWIPYAFNMLVTQRRVKNKVVISSYLDHFYKKTHNIVIPATCDISESKWNVDIKYVKNIIGKFDGITLIYAGNPGRKDLLHTVINVIQRLINEKEKIRFIILGITRENYLERYSNMLAVPDLSSNIKFIGRVSQDLVPAFYNNADFMVLLRNPTRKSNAGFPTKFAESIVSGTPVIANLTSDIGAYLKNGITGFVVKSPSNCDLYELLKQNVLKCDHDAICKMKRNVYELSSKFDYHAYIRPIAEFMDYLK